MTQSELENLAERISALDSMPLEQRAQELVAIEQALRAQLGSSAESAPVSPTT